jgi:Alpha-L-arabinofuranosidase C-terminal domain
VKFSLTPLASDRTARFAIKLEQPGSVEFGYALLEPAPWGRFKGLPDRKDVVDGLLDQGVTVLRYGGSMVNAQDYRWKKMTGPRERRPPYRGFWHPDSSDGWGIIDFLNLCEAAGFLPIPDFNIDETPQDMADFIEYVNGPRDSEWGRKRVRDGHAAPYRLTHLELGNEERVDENYWRKFRALADAIWAKDTNVIPVVGDFAYNREIHDPFDFKGSDAGITTLSAQQKILELAKQHNCEVWFDVHVNTEGPAMSSSVAVLPSFVNAIDKIAAGAKHHVAVFELNANNHQQRRALSNAQAIILGERLGLPVVTSANGLQPDGQNDNGWNQGLLFLNPSQVWLQPPGYVTQMISRNYEPLLVTSDVRNAPGGVEVAALRSEDGKTLIVQVVNFDAESCETKLVIDHFSTSRSSFKFEELVGPFNAENTAGDPNHIRPTRGERPLRSDGASIVFEFPAHSFSVLRFE